MAAAGTISRHSWAATGSAQGPSSNNCGISATSSSTFKRGITVEEYETLAAGREWMLLKARAAEARREEAKQ